MMFLRSVQARHGITCAHRLLAFTVTNPLVALMLLWGWSAGEVQSRQKVFVTVGHQTRMARPQCFGLPDGEGCTAPELLALSLKRSGKHAWEQPFSLARDYAVQSQLHGLAGTYSVTLLLDWSQTG